MVYLIFYFIKIGTRSARTLHFSKAYKFHCQERLTTNNAGEGWHHTFNDRIWIVQVIMGKFIDALERV